MSINLDLQNWPSASSPPLPPCSTPLQMMNRSAADKVDSNADNEVWNRCYLKLSKTCTEEEEQGLSVESSIPVFTSEKEEHQMLSFSAGSHKVPHLPHFYNNSASQYYNNPNFTGNNNYFGGATNMHDLWNGPFTPSQWMELEQQALIYKHITSNMPVPSTLLIPIRRPLNHAAAFSRYNSGQFSSMGWGGFHLGLQNYNNDPEPGRCRRTDGKKWRCSRDAVADQKYCERHINRGRHRSRKPVEGQSRYSVGKQIPASSVVLAGNIGSGSNFLISEKRKISLNEKNLHDLGTSESVAINSRNSCDARVGVDSHNLLVPPPSLVLHPRESLYNIHNSKPGASYAQLFGSDFGLVSSDALKNTSGQSIIMHSKSYEDKIVTTERIRPHSPSTHQFIDGCPKNQPDHTSTMWPNLDDAQFSISVPTAYHHMKDSPSPLTLAWEFDSMPKGLELGGSRYTDQPLESDDKHPNWIPILRDSIAGGPLGEVLQNSAGTNNSKTMNTSPGLSLMTDGWDKCPNFTSSPTGVLQKEAAFVSRTNSSARAETGMAPTS